MKYAEINDPEARRKAKEVEARVEASDKEQALALMTELSDSEVDGRCFGTHEHDNIDCRRCWLEMPCLRLNARFRTEWGEPDGPPRPEDDEPPSMEELMAENDALKAENEALRDVLESMKPWLMSGDSPEDDEFASDLAKVMGWETEPAETATETSEAAETVQEPPEPPEAADEAAEAVPEAEEELPPDFFGDEGAPVDEEPPDEEHEGFSEPEVSEVPEQERP